MRSIVIAYEDQYCEKLHLLVKALRKDRGLPKDVCLESRSVRGTGGFVNEVPKLLRMPLKQTKLPPDLVVCLGDADRPKNLAPDAPPAPGSADARALDGWVVGLENQWRDFLVHKANIDATSAARLRTVCLRWNKESLFLATPDALLDYAAQRDRRAQVESLLNACTPCPSSLADEAFTPSYRSTDRCLDLVFRKIEGRSYKKGRDDEDLLRLHITPHETRRTQALMRCPDLGRLLDRLG